jgi:hypothetical protein
MMRAELDQAGPHKQAIWSEQERACDVVVVYILHKNRDELAGPEFPHSFMHIHAVVNYAHETRQKTIKNALFLARLLILPEKMYFSL